MNCNNKESNLSKVLQNINVVGNVLRIALWIILHVTSKNQKSKVQIPKQTQKFLDTNFFFYGASKAYKTVQICKNGLNTLMISLFTQIQSLQVLVKAFSLLSSSSSSKIRHYIRHDLHILLDRHRHIPHHHILHRRDHHLRIHLLDLRHHGTAIPRHRHR